MSAGPTVLGVTAGADGTLGDAAPDGTGPASHAAVPLALDAVTWTPSTRSRPTIDDLTLHIPAGQRVLLTGPSGGGKSTVLRALTGLLDTSTGDLAGDATGPTRPGERGLLLQQPLHALIGGSVGRDAAFGPENAALDREEIQRRVTSALHAARVGLDAATSPWDLSGGQQQRLALAGSLALDPGALLLDEPLSMLDRPTARAVRAAILDVVGDRTLVVADHDADGWAPHVDRVIVLGAQAHVLADGAPDDVLEQPDPAATPDPATAPDPTAMPAPARASGTSGTPVLSLSRVSIARRRRRDEARGKRTIASPLLEGIDLAVPAGCVAVLTGPSGSGKTTLLRTILGLADPAGGHLERPEPSRIAFVPQEPEHSFVARTVRTEVTASPWAHDPGLAESLLQRADLGHLSDAQPFELSGGEQRRLAIIAALAQEPALLVLDEPTVGLDQERRTQMFALLEEATARGCAVLAATHDPDLITRAHVRLDLAEHGGTRDDDAQSASPEPAATGTALALAPATAPASASASASDTTLRPPRRPRPAPADVLNPLTTIAIAVAAAVGSFAIDRWQLGLLSCVLVAVLAPLAVRGVRSTALRLIPIALAAVGLCWSTVLASPLPVFSGTTWLLGLKEALRIGYFVAPGVLIFASLDPTRLGDALGGRLRLPGRPVAASVAGLVRAGLTADVWERIMTSRRLRGLGARRDLRHPLRSGAALVRLLASCTLALLVDAVRGTEQQALAMDARGFATAQHRTWALPSPFTRGDLVGLAAAALLLAAPWVLRTVLGG
ncbi:ATP-binding cassette domain-containing protein [Brachybacterium sp. MASK1Z-5]|uniref:ATP-binding cassette domain-containing protein n=1 Tax=Brachybacterium halotolerans TaxID=2795215 RepID=A0ABS1B7S9_9MICO|nr:ATP-binding cassette domain-containing protein [Brachybacterium halotolerans]MBK0330686.1 ATP-binding cassette domain-containing protein [Brachybacterium halotolerans]MBK0333074.1 ATP-binding cassette domain-containing protein [Brachybacterium halotolerans]